MFERFQGLGFRVYSLGFTVEGGMNFCWDAKLITASHVVSNLHWPVLKALKNRSFCTTILTVSANSLFVAPCAYNVRPNSSTYRDSFRV